MMAVVYSLLIVKLVVTLVSSVLIVALVSPALIIALISPLLIVVLLVLISSLLMVAIPSGNALVGRHPTPLMCTTSTGWFVALKATVTTLMRI